MRIRASICCLLLCVIIRKVSAENGNNFAIITAHNMRDSIDVNLFVENTEMDDQKVILSLTDDPTKVQLYAVPEEWSDGSNYIPSIIKDIGTPQFELINPPKVLIQLNDVIHTPGDYLKYRILLTDDRNRAGTEQLFNVTIALVHEKRNTVVSQDVTLYPGANYCGEYLFTDEHANGDWNITVTIGTHTTSKQFRVKPYTAPIHKITIDTGDMITQRDAEISVDVTAMYTFGKPITGTLNISFSIDDHAQVIERTASIVGRTTIKIPMNELLNNQSPSGINSLNVNATITTTNGITQRMYNATRTITIYRSPYKLAVESVVDFTPGENATLFVKVVKANGKPLLAWEKPPRDTVFVYVDYFEEDGEVLEKSKVHVIRLAADYTAIFSFPTNEDASYLKANLQYDMSTSITVRSSFDPQLNVSTVPSNQGSDDFKLEIVASKRLDGVLAIIRKHSGKNVPLLIACNQQYTHKHYVDGVQLREVKRVYAIAMFDGFLVQASTPEYEPALSEEAHLSVDSRNIKVFTSGTASYAGIAAYEGWLDEAKFNDTYTRAMFNRTVYPEISEIFPQYTENYKLSAVPETERSVDQEVLDLEKAPKMFDRLLLWEHGNISNHQTTFQFTPPSHINQMVVTAFVFSPTGGLGIAKPIQWQRPSDVQIHLHIPYSAKKMEAVTVDVYIVNNRDRRVNLLLVELLNTANEFMFLDNFGRTDATKKTVYGRLKPYEVQRTEFLISPKKLGSITLRANAYTESDLIARAETILHTIPESVLRTGLIVKPVKLVNSSETFPPLKIDIPKTADNGSETITFRMHRDHTEIGALSASMLVDKLVEADPFTMAMRTALTYEVLKLGKLAWNERRTLAARMMYKAIGKIESYANPNGSFTIPDPHQPSSPCWDTVIAVQALTYTNEHLDSAALEEIILRALDFLKSKQARDGHFCVDDGEQNAMERVEKTAHVLLAFLRMKDKTSRYESVIKNAKNYLLSTLHDPYHLALVGYALQLSLPHSTGNEERRAISKKVNHIWSDLLDRKKDSMKDHTMWWNSVTSKPDMVATAYALMLMTSTERIFDAARVVNWIKGQPYRQASNFTITPNSHIALRSLIEYARHTIFVEREYRAVITATGKNGLSQHTLQHDSGRDEVILPSATRSVSVSINGTLSGSFGIYYSYMESVTKLENKKNFEINVTRYSTSNQDYTDWYVCIRYNPKASQDVSRGMVTCEIAFPTGYIALDDSVDELNRLDDLVATSLRNDETLLVITFETIDSRPKCFNVTGFRRKVETRQLPGTIKVFDITDRTNIGFMQFDTKSELKD